jgi:hypothetical protein
LIVRELRFVYILVLAHVSALAFAACDSDADDDEICDPGTNVFCRCPGGEAGTRECNKRGDDFGECVIAPGVPCGERVECVAYTTIPCICPDGESGVKECLREETGYGECTQPNGAPCGESNSTTTTSGGGGGGGCTHDVCSTGDPLAPSCGVCAAAVCAVDDYCCSIQWDAVCVDLADDHCDNLCNPVVLCAHDLCEPGPALADGCDPCVTSVCSADDYCCNATNGQWDGACIAFVKNGLTHPACSGKCCAHSECTTGAKLKSTCSNCASTVCGLDSWCCTNEWDALCVQKASNEPSCNCN